MVQRTDREQHRDKELVIIPKELAVMSREGVAEKPEANNPSIQRLDDVSPNVIKGF